VWRFSRNIGERLKYNFCVLFIEETRVIVFPSRLLFSKDYINAMHNFKVLKYHIVLLISSET